MSNLTPLRAEHDAATERARTVRAQVRDTWGSEPPRTPEALPAWAVQSAAQRVGRDPRVTDADRAVETALADQNGTRQRHQHERRALLVREFGADQARRDQYGMRTINPLRNAHDNRTRAAEVRAEADELRSLPVDAAAQRIETERAEPEQLRRRAAERARQHTRSQATCWSLAARITAPMRTSLERIVELPWPR